MKLNFDNIEIDYLYRLVAEAAKVNPDHAVFNILEGNNVVKKITWEEITQSMYEYDEILKAFSNKVCAVYCAMGSKLVGFILSACKNNIKILIRRMTLENPADLISDLESAQDTVPVEFIFTDIEIKTDKVRKYNNELYYVEPTTDIDQYSSSSENQYNFIQYSSGSSNSPKAYCLNMATVISSAMHVADVQHISKNSITLTYLTFSHIYGLVTGLIVPLLIGNSCFYIEGRQVTENPGMIYSIITKFKITHVSVIVSTLQRGLEKKLDEDWNLKSLVCASLGGEVVRLSQYLDLQTKLMCHGLNPMALTNSYGMSEKGALTMENPKEGNTYITNINYPQLSELRDSSLGYLAVGDTKYRDQIKLCIFSDEDEPLQDLCVGKIGVNSKFLSRLYFEKRNIQQLVTKTIMGEPFYFNGDCGFVWENKLFITGRDFRVITYNGLKLAAEILDSFVCDFVGKHGYAIRRSYCFNYPLINNCVVCFIDCRDEINNFMIEKVKKTVLKQYHIKLSTVIVQDYTVGDIGKFKISEMIKQYEEKLGESGEIS